MSLRFPFCSSLRLKTKSCSSFRPFCSPSDVFVPAEPVRNSDCDVQRVKVRDRDKQQWVDSLRVFFKAGTGGNGYQPKGGRGGRGGDCVIRVKTSQKVPNLYSVYKRFPQRESDGKRKQRVVAGSGQHSSGWKIIGVPGEEGVLEVPVGITVSDEQGRMICQLDEEEMEVYVAKGGEGGGPVRYWYNGEKIAKRNKCYLTPFRTTTGSGAKARVAPSAWT